MYSSTGSLLTCVAIEEEPPHLSTKRPHLFPPHISPRGSYAQILGNGTTNVNLPRSTARHHQAWTD